MNEPGTDHRVFVGLWSNLDPHDLQAGQATIMVNCWSPRPGELAVRPGLREMEYDTE